MHTTTSYAVCYSTIRPSAVRPTGRRTGRRAKALAKLTSIRTTACNAPRASFYAGRLHVHPAVATAAGHLQKLPSRTRGGPRLTSAQRLGSLPNQPTLLGLSATKTEEAAHQERPTSDLRRKKLKLQGSSGKVVSCYTSHCRVPTLDRSLDRDP